MKRVYGLLAAGLVLLPCAAAQAGGMATGAQGMTLYTFDKDKGGEPSCYQACAAQWPPYLAEAGQKMAKGWTTVKRSDGSMQWAYDGKPAYYYAGDSKPGDRTGDGKGGVWHVIP